MTTSAQSYCTADEILREFGRSVSPETLMEKVESASITLKSKIGNFIPINAIKTFEASRLNARENRIYFSSLLEPISIKKNGEALNSDEYELLPQERLWENGPYIGIEFDSLICDDEIEITGFWGLYQEEKDLGISGSQTTTSVTTLDVTNAGVISVGMILQIEDEQETVTEGKGSLKSPSPTKATSKVNGAIVDIESEQIIVVDNGSEFHPGEVLRIDSEDMYIEKIATNSLTVIRGWNGSSPANHVDDSDVYVYRSFSVVRGVNGTTAAIHSTKEIYQLTPPADVNYMCRQVAILMQMKSESGFQGRVGNAETGESGFYSEFPPKQLEEIRSHYPNLE